MKFYIFIILVTLIFLNQISNIYAKDNYETSTIISDNSIHVSDSTYLFMHCVNQKNIEHFSKHGPTEGNKIDKYRRGNFLFMHYLNLAFQYCDKYIPLTYQKNAKIFSIETDQYREYQTALKRMAISAIRTFLLSKFGEHEIVNVGDVDVLPNGRYMIYLPNNKWERCLNLRPVGRENEVC